MDVPSSDHVDVKILNNLKELFEDQFLGIANKYFDDFESNQQKLNNCLNENNYTEAAKIVHGLKGNSLNMGAKQLAVYCSALEQQLKLGNADEIQIELENFKSVYSAEKKAYLECVNKLQ